GTQGVRVYPRLETALPRQVPALDGRESFGIAELDAILGGGVPRGDAALLLGPSGVGKTVLSLHFVQAGLEAGAGCMYVSLQETEGALLERAAGAGWDWRRHLGDRLVLRHVPPVELDLDEVGAVLRDDLAHAPIGRVVVDSLAELAFASDEPKRL